MSYDKQKILIVDDERFYINLLVELLSEDYNMVVAKDGKQTLERALDGPDLILLDIVMPGMDGYEICRKLKADERTRDIPVIFLTVKSELNDEVLGFELGAVDYISKPISPAIVKARVATHIALSDARNRLDLKNKTLVTEQKIKDEQLRRSEKLAALGKLTGGIAHDFNNILGIILGYAELMQEKLPDDESLANYIAHIVKAGDRGKIITQKLLAFSRHDSSNPENIYINDLLESDYNMFSKTLTARITLSFDLEKNIWPVYLDKSDLQDAILNMCINAMHAMPTGGSLTIETHNEHLSPENARNLSLPVGDYVLLAITDTGCGMDKQTQSQIFDPFFSTKGEKGTGLGMSQVYRLVVQQSKGTICVDSEVGRGTRITLYFPRNKDIQNKSEESKNIASIEVDYSGHESVLVVDDEEAIREMLEEVLKSRGYHVLCAEDAETALEILENEQVNLILSDVIMPGIDGYKFVTTVLKKQPNMKIQMLSGFGENNNPNEINETLHQKRLQKPVHMLTLLKRVRELLDNSL